MNKKFKNKDQQMVEENVLKTPKFYTKKCIYGYIFVSDVTQCDEQLDLIG